MEHDKRVEVLASIQLLASAVGWESMKDNWGLTGEQAAKAAQWAVQALLQAAAQEAPADRETL
jgi:RNA 3'-terminal phosphate cyclase